MELHTIDGGQLPHSGRPVGFHVIFSFSETNYVALAPGPMLLVVVDGTPSTESLEAWSRRDALRIEVRSGQVTFNGTSVGTAPEMAGRLRIGSRPDVPNGDSWYGFIGEPRPL